MIIYTNLCHSNHPRQCATSVIQIILVSVPYEKEVVMFFCVMAVFSAFKKKIITHGQKKKKSKLPVQKVY